MVVVDQSVRVDVEFGLEARVEVAVGKAIRCESVIALVDRNDAERFDIDHRGRDVGGVSDIELQPTNWQRVREWRDRQADVVAAVEVRAVGPVQLAPSATAIGTEPQVRLVKISE